MVLLGGLLLHLGLLGGFQVADGARLLRADPQVALQRDDPAHAEGRPVERGDRRHDFELGGIRFRRRVGRRVRTRTAEVRLWNTTP